MTDRREQRAGSVPGVGVTAATPGIPSRFARFLVVVWLVASATTAASAAYATWRTRGADLPGVVAARALPRAAAPSAGNVAYGADVHVSWPAAAYPDGRPVGGYVVRVEDAVTGASRPSGGTCAGRLTTTACDDRAAPDGRWRYSLDATDGAAWTGATSAASGTVTVDTTAPTAVTLFVPGSSVRSGARLTGTAFDPVTGVASISYLSCAGASCTPQTPIGTSSTGPDFGVVWTDQPGDGTYRVLARATDGAGHAADSAARTVVVDNSAPVVTLNAPADGSATNARTVTVAGAAGDASGDSSSVEVQVYAGPVASGPIVQTLAATRTGQSFTVTSGPLVDGTYTVVAVQTDAAGNVGMSASRTVTVDASGPTVVGISGSDGDGKIEKNDTLRLTFSEPLDPATVPVTTTVSVTNVGGVGGAETLNIAGVTDGPVATGAVGAAWWNQTTVWSASVTLSAANTVLTVTVTQQSALWAGGGTKAGVLQFVPAQTLKDRAGNAAGGLRAQTVQLF